LYVIYRALPGGSDLIILYYCLMATWTGLGDNTELFWVVLSHSAYTGQTGAPDRSDRSGQELGEFSVSTFPRDLALACVDQKSVNRKKRKNLAISKQISN
jgi:hypothetical protein